MFESLSAGILLGLVEGFTQGTSNKSERMSLASRKDARDFLDFYSL